MTGVGNDDARGRALSFGGVADAYERGRPDYPLDAALWLTGERPARVLELGAGTGKLTRALLGLGHDVHATDPDPAMLEVLQREVPGAGTAVGTAEEIAAPDRTYDVVVAAQSFHFFDLELALPEIARVLRPGGRLALVWNERDTRIPWVKRLGALIGTPDALRDPSDDLVGSELFGSVEATQHKFRQHLDRQAIQDLALSSSSVAVLDEPSRAATLTDVLALYDEYGRGMDGMALPYFTRSFRATVEEVVVLRPDPTPDTPAPDEPTDQPVDGAPASTETASGRDPMRDTMPRGLRSQVRPVRAAEREAAAEAARRRAADDDQMILIDFH